MMPAALIENIEKPHQEEKLSKMSHRKESSFREDRYEESRQGSNVFHKAQHRENTQSKNTSTTVSTGMNTVFAILWLLQDSPR